MAAARQSLIDPGVAPTGTATSHNRITVDTIQLRLSRRGAWWLFLEQGTAWELDAGPAAEPDELLFR
ncbi:MAG: hypothetical protein OEV40_29910 [Acidimicrobiia bacterium]|nr:hypothetical protein [Acidimicrobiia bacterium]